MSFNASNPFLIPPHWPSVIKVTRALLRDAKATNSAADLHKRKKLPRFVGTTGRKKRAWNMKKKGIERKERKKKKFCKNSAKQMSPWGFSLYYIRNTRGKTTAGRVSYMHVSLLWGTFFFFYSGSGISPSSCKGSKCAPALLQIPPTQRRKSPAFRRDTTEAYAAIAMGIWALGIEPNVATDALI